MKGGSAEHEGFKMNRGRQQEEDPSELLQLSDDGAGPSNDGDNHWEPKLEPKHTIFLSHSGVQKNFTEQLCVDLESSDYSAFFDKRPDSLPKGKKFPELIFQAARQCRVAIFVLSEDFFTRTKWPMLELEAFVQSLNDNPGNLKILPVYLGLSLHEFTRNETRLGNWLSVWRGWAETDRRIDLRKWQAALKVLVLANGIEYVESLGEVTLRKQIVSAVRRLIPPESSWIVGDVQGRTRTFQARNRWAELCQLGVSSQECSRERFLECCSSWFMKLLPVLKQQTDPDFVRSAALASITDIIVRLGGLIDVAATVRRDGASLISKLLQPLLQLIGDKGSNVLLDEAMDLLIAVLKYFPNCLRQQSISVEVSLVARLADANCHSSVRKKCAKALAFLPKAHGDSASWSSLMRRVLIAVNADLDFAFRGMEDASVAEGATRALLPVGQDPPRPLGGQSSMGIQPGKNLWQQLLPRILSLLQCCDYLLTSPYPTPVPAPVGPLLTLVMRILRVDGSRSSSLVSSQQVSLRAELPALHLSALELLTATLRGVRGQLLPRGAALANLLSDHFRHTGGRYPSLRVKLYAISRDLFIAMGAGMVSALAPAVVGSALLDLKGSSSRENLSSDVAKASGVGRGSQGINSRKRKEAGGLPGDHSINGLAEVTSTEGRAPAAVQIAALQALEALLNTGGVLLPERWRAEVDAVVADVAIRVAADTSSFNLSCDDESSYSKSANTTSISVDVQVAAYQALLSSLLAPGGRRPPYLAVGLALFRNGRKEVGTDVATVCARALMALELLIHPRCLPAAVPVTDMSMSKSGHTSSRTGLVRGNDNGTFGGSSMKIGHLSMDPWELADSLLGCWEDTGDDDVVMSHSERTNTLPNGGANPLRVTSANGSLEEGLAADRVTGDEEPLTIPPSEPMVEDPVQTQTEIVVPENTTPVFGDSIEVCLATPESRVPDSPSKQGHGVQTPITTNMEEPLLTQGSELQSSQPIVNRSDMVTVTTGIVTPASATASGPVSTSQGHQEATLESKTIVIESIKVTTTTEQNPTLPKVIELGSDSDSDGPLPDIVDGDPDSESD